MAKILLVDDDPQALGSTCRILQLEGHTVDVANDGREGLDKVGTQKYDLVVSDVRMPRMSGIEFLRALTMLKNRTPLILMTAFGQVDEAVEAMKLGADDFLTKPFKRQTLLVAVEKGLRMGHVKGLDQAESQLIGKSSVMEELRSQLAQVAPTQANVLILGESGSGKEVVARWIHTHSLKKTSPFIALNCSAIPENLIESELFGYERGAFSGAQAGKIGLIEAADGGTLFLDEIGDMPVLLQAKLLRVLQEREVRRVGSNQTKKIEVRVLAATHQNLEARVRNGLFREDLLYRLDVVRFHVPPLQERGSDLEELCIYFLNKFNLQHDKKISGISKDALGCLRAHGWPGNVRELANVLERAVVLARENVIQVSDLPNHLAMMQTAAPSRPIEIKVGTSLKDVESLLIQKTLEATSGDKEMAAKLLGVNSRTIYRKLEKKVQDSEAESTQ